MKNIIHQFNRYNKSICLLKDSIHRLNSLSSLLQLYMNTTISSMAPLQEQMNQCIHTIQQVFIYLLNSLLQMKEIWLNHSKTIINHLQQWNESHSQSIQKIEETATQSLVVVQQHQQDHQQQSSSLIDSFQQEIQSLIEDYNTSLSTQFETVCLLYSYESLVYNAMVTI